MQLRNVYLYAALAAGVFVSLTDAPHAVADDRTELMRKRTVHRARRAIAFGPTLGGAAQLRDGSVDGTVSVGLGLYLFKVDVVPMPASVVAGLRARALEEALIRAQELIDTGEVTSTSGDVEVLAESLVDKIQAGLEARLLAQGKRFERPKLAIDIEGTLGLRAELWGVRTTLGYGLGPVTLGPTAWLTAHDAAVGPELVIRLLSNRGPRPTVLNLYVRADFALRDRGEREDVYGVGMRVMLDAL